MTVPTLMSKYNEAVTVAKLKKSHSILSNALGRAIAENGTVDNWDLGSSNNLPYLFNILSPYLKLEKNFNTTGKCLPGPYKSLYGGAARWPLSHFMYGSGILADGMGIAIWSTGNTPLNHSKTNTEPLNSVYGVIHIDINGPKGPNQAGVDYFDFIVTKDRIVPSGTQDFNPLGKYNCKYKDTSDINGQSCTAWVLQKQNMDYLRRDISSEW